MSSPEYLVFGQPLIARDEIDEVVDSMQKAWLGTGPKAAAFEKSIAAYKTNPGEAAPFAVGLNSCTAGLHLSCLALDLQPGDEVITTAMTFCATVNAIIHAGATPVLADVDPSTFNIDPADVRRKITPKTKALLPVHFAGRPCDMDALMAIAKEHNLHVIEDCAHAIETLYKGRAAGTFGDCGALSFYSTKNIVTGEGGMVITKDEAIAARIKMLALHGMSLDAWKRFSDDGYKHYDVAEVGFKYNMMDLQAAIGLRQMEKIGAYLERRLVVWNRYQEAFADLPIGLPAPLEDTLSTGSRHALHLYTVLIDPARTGGITRDALLLHLHRLGIGTGVHYRAIPTHSAYKKRFGWDAAAWPVAHRIGEQTVSLPLSAKLTDADIDRVISGVKGLIK
ncbi:dTDP-4-amino-4,6-dideoxygalactose transaminase [Verrucomicrobium sp. GAS474]|uniref:DegT/DnrJ/EryC1/StrS family aminotransferase n=1 Tax=Verrucomicrobium sp. GAS474 TaxID=1882831 RepID=UPI00087AC9D8|nr:DegT/DnrJ/EryC1/StrS family aminotransferase [Verrucomicrobium sp. GAS474]SDU00678.1 dTDP-4-amino-4,6-dideoxygalactose transaminase [Verrucomicrobium sp. GAS474]